MQGIKAVEPGSHLPRLEQRLDGLGEPVALQSSGRRRVEGLASLPLVAPEPAQLGFERVRHEHVTCTPAVGDLTA